MEDSARLCWTNQRSSRGKCPLATAHWRRHGARNGASQPTSGSSNAIVWCLGALLQEPNHGQSTCMQAFRVADAHPRWFLQLCRARLVHRRPRCVWWKVELQPRGPRERKPGPSSVLPHSQSPLPCSRELCTTVSERGCAGSETKIGRACVGKGAQPTSRSRAICWRRESVAFLLVIQFQSFSVTFTLRNRSPFLSSLLLPCPQSQTCTRNT